MVGPDGPLRQPRGRPAAGEDAAPKDVADVTHRLREQARRLEAAMATDASARPLRDEAPAGGPAPSLISGLSPPMLNLAIAGFAGYGAAFLTARR